MTENIKVLLTEEEVNRRISEVAEEINRDYNGEAIHLICILKGGAMFMCELAKRLNGSVSFDFMDVSSYGSGTESTGVIKILKDLDDDISGKNVIIVEDIIDTGRTLNNLSKLLMSRGPKSIRICTMLDKPSRRVEKEVKVDYRCFEIPNKFVIGYGLDYDQKYRNLPYIGVVEFED
ncbi:MAG: hypoxanthine phosphoribosyltransferase [Lachnospiraceae bacterium]|nr:hypoxanthine phosphoribosyltransferase [Candidatus Darwinimomas equi]